jgi:hypothetical protein
VAPRRSTSFVTLLLKFKAIQATNRDHPLSLLASSSLAAGIALLAETAAAAKAPTLCDRLLDFGRLGREPLAPHVDEHFTHEPFDLN